MIDIFGKKKRIIKEIKRRWGQLPDKEYSSDQLEGLKYYYSKHVDVKNDIDDITWNDLDMDSFYMLINNTCSSMGEEYLYSILRKPYFDTKTQAERERVMGFFDSNEEMRLQLAQTNGFKIKK